MVSINEVNPLSYFYNLAKHYLEALDAILDEEEVESEEEDDDDEDEDDGEEKNKDDEQLSEI